jgi:hypothetical protein
MPKIHSQIARIFPPKRGSAWGDQCAYPLRARQRDGRLPRHGLCCRPEYRIARDITRMSLLCQENLPLIFRRP